MAVSILNRKRDLTYLVYFSIHLCIMFRESPPIDVEPLFAFRPILSPDPPPFSVVDLATLYPAQYTPALSATLHRYQAEAYQDAFFVAGGEGDVPFFKFFTWMEAAVHVPVALWSLGALVRGTLPLLFCGFVLFVLLALPCFCAVGDGNGSDGFGKLGRQRRLTGRRKREEEGREGGHNGEGCES